MSELFTQVEVAFYPEYVNHWLRFGVPDEEFDLDRRRSLSLFKDGRVFGYVRWISNVYGTQKWHFTVVRTVGLARLLSRIDGVHPGGEVLLAARGQAKVKQVLSRIDTLESDGFDPAEVSDSYYRHVHNRLSVRRPIRAYSRAQHEAVLAARRVRP